MPSLNDSIQAPKGRLTIWDINDASGVWMPLATVDNLVLYTWGASITKGWGQKNISFCPSAMYIEYANVASPGDTVSIPSYDRTSTLSYYNTLTPPVDFIRANFVSTPALSVVPGYEAYFGPGLGNELTFFAQTSGTAGFLGLPFSDINNSTVYGAGLVATPVPADQTQDIVIARTYLQPANQKLKVAGSQIGLSWIFPFL
jgi:hypothetical protein